MKMHIIGGPGSGKTWLAEHVSATFNVPAFDLDDIFWDRSANRYGVRNSPEKRDAELRAIINRESWIVEGVYYAWLMNSFEKSDLIAVLETSVLLRDVRIIRRFIKRKLGAVKTKKESLRDLWQLIIWNHGYNKNNLKPALDFIAGFKEKIVIYESYEQIVDELRIRGIAP
jgi:adenylate kinase family enzyme